MGRGPAGKELVLQVAQLRDRFITVQPLPGNPVEVPAGMRLPGELADGVIHRQLAMLAILIRSE